MKPVLEFKGVGPPMCRQHRPNIGRIYAIVPPRLRKRADLVVLRETMLITSAKSATTLMKREGFGALELWQVRGLRFVAT
jgi:hypothetical protein